MGFFDRYPYTNWHNVNLDWVLERVKEWGELVKENDQAFKDLQEANEAFKQYVTEYLQNLDVQEEINIKMDSLLESGVLTEYLQPYISTDVTTWLEDNITEPEGVVIDTSLTVTGACADSKAVGENLYISKATICYGEFNINTENRTLEITRGVALADQRNRVYTQFTARTVEFTNQSDILGFHHMLFYKRSRGELFLFVPYREWENYDTYNAEMQSNPRDYLYLFDVTCNGIYSYYAGTEGRQDIYKINGLSNFGPITPFEEFKNNHRAIPYSFNANFTTISSINVKGIILQKNNGNGFEGYASNYTVDWSNLQNPAEAKLAIINKTTKQLEVVQSFEESYLKTHLYLGFVYDGAFGDVQFVNSESVLGHVSQYKVFDLNSDTYREIFKRYKSLYKIIQKVGVVGDSLAVGYMLDSSNAVHPRNLKYSWVKNMQRDSGVPYLIFGNSGQNVLTWCSSTYNYGLVQALASGNKCQVYIIGLGVNDASVGTSRYVPLGSQNDIVSNPDTVATTYYGGYARIIQLLKRNNNNCIVVCLTNPLANDNAEEYNNAVRYICNTYYNSDNKVILLDLYNYKNLFKAQYSELTRDRARPMAGGHYTPYGYRFIADVMELLIGETIYNNRSAFENLPFINYDEGYGTGDV